MTITEMQQAIREAQGGMVNASDLMRQATTRIQNLESALNRMVLEYENTLADSEGKWPQPDSGCIKCTAGCVPLKYDTGLCCYHESKRLLGHD